MFLVLVLFVAASLCSAAADNVECESGLWRCDDGQCVKAAACDGELQCSDGTDETLARCKSTQRPLLALILHCSQPGASSDAVCPDACRRWPQYCYYAIAAENGVPGTCELPPYPRVGDYRIEAIEPARGGAPSRLADFTLLYSCPPGYSVHGYHPRCVSGAWNAGFPSCTQDKKCQLKKDPSVDYECIGVLSSECPEWVASWQRVSAVCRPGYARVTPAQTMMCVDGIWINKATCRPECGTKSAELNSTDRRGEMPWHTAVYSKLYTPYMKICSGTLVSSVVVISSAHCFWSDKNSVASAEHYAVGVGKIYRAWNIDNDGQRSDVSDIKVPPRFTGNITKYQDDIAVVVLTTQVLLNIYVRPVCLDFGAKLDDLQLRPGNVGKIAGWPRTEVLKVMEISNLDVTLCKGANSEYVEYVTSDKICGQLKYGDTFCMGDTGGGLVFAATDAGVERWYLRGVVSTAPHGWDVDNCVDYFIGFTQITKHEAFINTHKEDLATILAKLF